MPAEYEDIDNIKLTRNNLLHIRCELGAEDPSPMRLAKECYQLLLRMMVETLRGTANIAITGRRSGDRKRWYRQDDNPWKMIQKVSIEGCNKAWRYSEPVNASPPDNQEEAEGVGSQNDYLADFYDLSAMIQTPCFLLQFCYSAVVRVSDAEMKLLEWLHECIRNEFEHFIPRTLLASSNDCLSASEVCLRLSSALLNESHNISPHRIGDLPALIHSVSSAVSHLRGQLLDQRARQEES